MSISLNENIAFTGKKARLRRAHTREEKKKEKEVVTGGGAVAATTAAARAKATKSGFDMFSSTSKVSQGMHGVTNTAKTASNVAKQTKSLWGKVAENAKWAKNAVINWGSKLKNTRMLKPLINSKLFQFGAGFLGYGFGFVTLISGLSDISKVTTDVIEKQTHKN